MTAYALDRPDDQWSLMLINKGRDHSHQVRITFHNADTNHDSFFLGPATLITFGKEQYPRHPARRQGYADPDGPPVTSTITGAASTLYNLPPASLNVLRGRLSSEP